MRDDEKEQYTKENDAGKRQQGDAATPTGSFSSRRSEVPSRLVCRGICWSEHKGQARPNQSQLTVSALMYLQPVISESESKPDAGKKS
jgi:hypothetical protein